jgi:hypothetical protein
MRTLMRKNLNPKTRLMGSFVYDMGKVKLQRSL